MEGTQSQVRPRQYPRPPSRSSTHTNVSRMTSASATSPSSQIATSPQISQSRSTQRYHHTQYSTGSPRPTSRPTPSLSRRESTELTHQTTVSSFLQEKLQRERKAELEKLSHPQSPLPRPNPGVNGSVELGGAPSYPIKTSTSEVNRPFSSSGHEHFKKKGHGVKEMEHVISTLHKQNFDLKLELYHRRERQSTLEERLAALERDKVRMEEVNDTLLIELEKRDKAVEEAVAMIVDLETKVDQLFRERSMVQQIENEPFFCPRDYNMDYQTPLPQVPGPDIAKMGNDAKVVNRMPSFLSDHSETTENLRNVYLGSKASFLSLPRVAESSSESDNIKALGSPTLSMLSESSFLSVYGRKDKAIDMDQAGTNVDETVVLDGKYSSFTSYPAENSAARGKARTASSSRNVGSRTSSSGHVQSMTDVIGGSSLQRLEPLDTPYAGKRAPGQCQTQGKDNMSVQFASQDRLTAQGAVRQDKRDTLRKVLTDGVGGVRLHDHGLPPTPDTIGSSTLRRLQGSNDTLLQAPDTNANEESSGNGDWFSGAGDGGNVRNSRCIALPIAGQSEMENWASCSRSNIDSLFQHRASLNRRPRSADESTTLSHNGGQAWDSDNDYESDIQSLRSSLDIWMREGTQSSRNKGRRSPDMLSFLHTGSQGSWAAEAMNSSGSVSADDTHPPPRLNDMRHHFSLRRGLFANAAPPPPNRRSSLHARTGSPEGGMSLATVYQSSEQGPTSAKRRSFHSRQGSVDVGLDLGRRDDLRTPIQGDQFAPPPHSNPGSDQKQRNYPPISSHQHGARAGLNRLFRRSVTGTAPAPVSENQAEADSLETVNNHHHATGLPLWASRSSAAEDDRSGATPPPITLNPRQMRRNTVGAEGEPQRPPRQDLHRSKTPGPVVAASAASAPGATLAVLQKEAAAAKDGSLAPSGPGTRRKWLPGFSRTSNSKNKTG